MGIGVTVHCKACKYEKEFYLGVGMKQHSFEDIISLFPSSDRETIKKIKDNHNIREKDYWNALFICPHCNSLHERLYARFVCYESILGTSFQIITDKAKKVFETKFDCKKCNKLLQIIPKEQKTDKDEVDDDSEDNQLGFNVKEELKKYPCGKCGKKQLEAEETAMWD